MRRASARSGRSGDVEVTCQSNVGLDNRNVNSVSSETEPELRFRFRSPGGPPHDLEALHRPKWLALALLAAAQFVVVLDASIVNVALPSIGRALDFSQDNLSWVVNAYTLTFGGFLLLGGRLADLLGRRRMFIAGLILFAVASLAGGLAQSEVWLIAARAVQGLGAAMLSPAALSIVTTTFTEGAERNKALGVWGAVAGSGGAAGVLLGGMLTQWAGWEWVLFVNVPIGLAAARSRPRLLPESRDDGRAPLRRRRRGHRDRRPVAARLRARRRRQRRLGLDADDRRCSPSSLVAARARSCSSSCARRHPLVPFPGSSGCRTLRGANVVGLLIGDVAVLDVLLHLALHAAGARLRRAEGRPRLPAAGGRDHRLGRRRVRARDAVRLQADADRGPAPHRGRAAVVLAGLGRTAPTSPTSCSRRCSPRSASASRSCR